MPLNIILTSVDEEEEVEVEVADGNIKFKISF